MLCTPVHRAFYVGMDTTYLNIDTDKYRNMQRESRPSFEKGRIYFYLHLYLTVYIQFACIYEYINIYLIMNI